MNHTDIREFRDDSDILVDKHVISTQMSGERSKRSSFHIISLSRTTLEKPLQCVEISKNENMTQNEEPLPDPNQPCDDFRRPNWNSYWNCPHQK